MSTYKRVGITIKSDFEGQREAVDDIIAILEKLKVQILLDEKRQDRLECGKKFECFSSEDDIDLLLVIGGDGTILRTVREMEKLSVPILSVNRGTVGFLAELEMDEAEELLPKLLNGDGMVEERELIDVRTFRNNKEIAQGIALNEAVIAQGMIARLVNLQTSVNGEPLTVFHADGLIISTPTGSTAYSLSAGGPIVHPALSALILTPINPHSFAQKPVLIRSDAQVEVQVLSKHSKFSDANIILTLDGQTYQPLETGDVVRVTKSTKTVKFLRRKQETFFGTLREKLKWGEGLED